MKEFRHNLSLLVIFLILSYFRKGEVWVQLPSFLFATEQIFYLNVEVACVWWSSAAIGGETPWQDLSSIRCWRNLSPHWLIAERLSGYPFSNICVRSLWRIQLIQEAAGSQTAYLKVLSLLCNKKYFKIQNFWGPDRLYLLQKSSGIHEFISNTSLEEHSFSLSVTLLVRNWIIGRCSENCLSLLFM